MLVRINFLYKKRYKGARKNIIIKIMPFICDGDDEVSN